MKLACTGHLDQSLRVAHTHIPCRASYAYYQAHMAAADTIDGSNHAHGWCNAWLWSMHGCTGVYNLLHALHELVLDPTFTRFMCTCAWGGHRAGASGHGKHLITAPFRPLLKWPSKYAHLLTHDVCIYFIHGGSAGARRRKSGAKRAPSIIARQTARRSSRFPAGVAD